MSGDHRNQLIRVRDLNSSGVEARRVDYTYDVFGQRLGKVVDLDGAGSQGAVTTRFVYDRNHVALEFSGNTATPIQRYLYGVQTDQILAQESNGVTTWHLADHQGSVRELIDNTGKIVNQYTYDSFGKLIGTPTGTVDTRYCYTGREWDSETGMYYYRARYYNTNTGRFISQDPIGFAAGDNNLYRYTGNDPLNRIDPSGLSDMRYPWNGAVVNLSKQPVYILTQNRYERLSPFSATPDASGRSKDVDGVWIWYTNSGWALYKCLCQRQKFDLINL